MYIPITTAALALLTVAMILLRIFWLRVPLRLRTFLVRVSIAVIVLHAIFAVTKWSTTSDRLNVLINWLAIVGYELLILLFSRLSPRWLTIPSAAVLLVPLFASIIVIPLTHLFYPGTVRTGPLDNHLFYNVDPWTYSGGGNAGVDVIIYYRPPFIPFLRHKLQTIPFNDQECDSIAAFAKPGPTPRTVLGRCPSRPLGSTGTFDKLLPLH
jgi:hypothetical protein